jgi:toxin ParE1/3/4
LVRANKTKLAEEDLDEIWFTIAVDDVNAADSWIDELEKKTYMLAANPKLGRLRPELLVADLRSYPVGKYLIFYRPDPEGIEIVRVVHGMRDLQNLF